MKTEKSIFLAFILNLLFAIAEIIGGALTGSVAIVSDAVHDLSDAASIGISYFLERKSRRGADKNHTFGFSRHSVLGSMITALFLLISSVFVIFKAFEKIINPTQISANGMLLFAVAGLIINLVAAVITHKGESLNQKAVSLHLFEDVLGWAAVLLGALIIKFTGFVLIDPLLSIAVSLFIFFHAARHLSSALKIFLLSAPEELDGDKAKEILLSIEEIEAVNHLHVWQLDEHNVCLSAHIVCSDADRAISKAQKELSKLSVTCITLQTDNFSGECPALHSHHCHCHHHH